MIETAAVWLDEAMTPALRTFLDQAIQVTAAEREFISPANFRDASVPRSRSLGSGGLYESSHFVQVFRREVGASERVSWQLKLDATINLFVPDLD